MIYNNLSFVQKRWNKIKLNNNDYHFPRGLCFFIVRHHLFFCLIHLLVVAASLFQVKSLAVCPVVSTWNSSLYRPFWAVEPPSGAWSGNLSAGSYIRRKGRSEMYSVTFLSSAFVLSHLKTKDPIRPYRNSIGWGC